MAIFFFDTSALVKRYVLETGTAWIQEIADPRRGNRLYILTIAAVETTSAVMRRERAGNLTIQQRSELLSQFQNDYANQYRVLDVTRSLIGEARLLAESHGLRAYDAVQLAGAIQTNAERLAHQLDPLTLVSADGDLNNAASTEGILVENPNAHP